MTKWIIFVSSNFQAPLSVNEVTVFVGGGDLSWGSEMPWQLHSDQKKPVLVHLLHLCQCAGRIETLACYTVRIRTRSVSLLLRGCVLHRTSRGSAKKISLFQKYSTLQRLPELTGNMIDRRSLLCLFWMMVVHVNLFSSCTDPGDTTALTRQLTATRILLTC